MVEDYPRTLMELERRFHDEQACAEYLARLRWPDGWICARCQGREAWQVRRNRWRCGRCRYEISVTAGTIFQDSHLPLGIWFRAMGYVTNQKNGISADWQYDPTLKTEIEVRFSADGSNRTRVELEHRHLGRYGACRDEMRAIFDTEGDWGRVLDAFAREAAA